MGLIPVSENECSLRSSAHSATGVTPYFALFGVNMVTHGSVYKLARKLKSLTDIEATEVPKSVTLDLIRTKIRDSLHQAYVKNERTYNTRTRRVKFIPGQESS